MGTCDHTSRITLKTYEVRAVFDLILGLASMTEGRRLPLLKKSRRVLS
jgi:hypothetical protein